MTVVIGTRGSELAMWQANYVRDALLRIHGNLDVRLDVIKTQGDQRLGADTPGPLDKGLFTREIERALLAGEVSLAVHSLKDLPTEQPDGVMIAAVPAREDPADVLISKSGLGLADLPAGATVLTGSPRRGSQVLHRRNDLRIAPIRGNVPTRLRKLAESDAEAVVLARAGLVRLGLDEPITERLDPAWFLPACGQGALALQVRTDDAETAGLAAALDDPASHRVGAAERAFLAGMGAGCRAPLGAYARYEGDELSGSGMIGSLDGSRVLCQEVSGVVADLQAAEALGQLLAQRLSGDGAMDIIDEARRAAEASEDVG